VQVQWQLRQLLQTAAGDSGRVYTEFPYRPLPEFECWSADVAFVATLRWQTIDDWLAGAPELVVEVLSPSNSVGQLRDKRKICLENGSREFWVVDTNLREVEVSTADGHAVTYKSGQEIPLFFGGTLPVDQIFA